MSYPTRRPLINENEIKNVKKVFHDLDHNKIKRRHLITKRNDEILKTDFATVLPKVEKDLDFFCQVSKTVFIKGEAFELLTGCPQVCLSQNINLSTPKQITTLTSFFQNTQVNFDALPIFELDDDIFEVWFETYIVPKNTLVYTNDLGNSNISRFGLFSENIPNRENKDTYIRVLGVCANNFVKVIQEYDFKLNPLKHKKTITMINEHKCYLAFSPYPEMFNLFLFKDHRRMLHTLYSIMYPNISNLNAHIIEILENKETFNPHLSIFDIIKTVIENREINSHFFICTQSDIESNLLSLSKYYRFLGKEQDYLLILKFIESGKENDFKFENKNEIKELLFFLKHGVKKEEVKTSEKEEEGVKEEEEGVKKEEIKEEVKTT